LRPPTCAPLIGFSGQVGHRTRKEEEVVVSEQFHSGRFGSRVLASVATANRVKLVRYVGLNPPASPHAGVGDALGGLLSAVISSAWGRSVQPSWHCPKTHWAGEPGGRGRDWLTCQNPECNCKIGGRRKTSIWFVQSLEPEPGFNRSMIVHLAGGVSTRIQPSRRASSHGRLTARSHRTRNRLSTGKRSGSWTPILTDHWSPRGATA